jgi:hypothetical protein
VTVTDEPGKLVAVPDPPVPIVKLIVPETASVVSSASSPPPPPPPEWELTRAVAPLPPAPQHWASAVLTPAGVDHEPLEVNVTVVMALPLDDEGGADSLAAYFSGAASTR